MARSGISAASGRAGNERNGLGRQLQRVVAVIRARRALETNKTIVFSGMGGIDTHGAQLPTHHNLLGRLDGALGANYTSLETDLQLAAETTSFTESECGRTGNPSSYNGSDHPCGSYPFGLGGSVSGSKAYGTFLAHVVRGPDDGECGCRASSYFPTCAISRIRISDSCVRTGLLVAGG